MTLTLIRYLRNQVENLPAYRILCETATQELTHISQGLVSDLIRLHPYAPTARDWTEWAMETTATSLRPILTARFL